jgi:hypothetical protein
MTMRLSTGFRNKQLGMAASIASNGTFDSDTTGWTASSATLSSVAGGQSGNCLSVAESGGVNPGQAYQDVTTVVGRVYKLSVYFKAGTAAEGKVHIGTTGDHDAILSSAALTDADWTQHTLVFIATDTTTRITLESVDATDGETSLFDELVLDEILDGVKEILRGCLINIYTGTQPATADSAATGTLLVTISESGSGTGLTWEDAEDGSIVKNTSETWQGTAVAGGTAGWFRCYESGGDPSAASTTEARFDGSIATSGGQLNISNTTIAADAVQTLSSLTYTQPGS